MERTLTLRARYLCAGIFGMQREQGIALGDIILRLHDLVLRVGLPPKVRIFVLKELADLGTFGHRFEMAAFCIRGCVDTRDECFRCEAGDKCSSYLLGQFFNCKGGRKTGKCRQLKHGADGVRPNGGASTVIFCIDRNRA